MFLNFFSPHHKDMQNDHKTQEPDYYLQYSYNKASLYFCDITKKSSFNLNNNALLNLHTMIYFVLQVENIFKVLKICEWTLPPWFFRLPKYNNCLEKSVKCNS